MAERKVSMNFNILNRDYVIMILHGWN